MEPEVCAVCITADRPDLTRKAVACFEGQTYRAKRLVIYDTSKAAGEIVRYHGHFQRVVIGGSQQTMGEMRNTANAFADPGEVIVQWDSDDFSDPNRIAEQVALLQSSGADCVGFNEMLFWREPSPELPCGEAWLYNNPNPTYALGTSLCYWRESWSRKPFAATNVGEDLQFCTGLKVLGLSSLTEMGSIAGCDPRMIARIHPGNTSTAYAPEKMRANSEWRRVPEWDDFCRSTMCATT